MSDDEVTEEVPQPPAGYIPVPEGEETDDVPVTQWVGERGGDAKEVHPTPDEVRQQQLDVLESRQGGEDS